MTINPLTASLYDVMIYDNRRLEKPVFWCIKNKCKKIEVAFFKSTFSDAAGAEEEKGKGNTPKEGMICSLTLGHAVKSCMTVICS
ncbi:MAG: hypothetical protein HFH95_04500 [Lachnospiraceae bacterium]|nr:hypothetical protein [Lachnospiraceae bacterium]